MCLFVLGEVGTGRSSLLLQIMPPGQGRELRQLMQPLTRTLQTGIPLRLSSADCKAESERIRNAYQIEESKACAELDTFAEARHFTLFRESGHLVFTLIGDAGRALTGALAALRRQSVKPLLDHELQVIRESL